ncbi:MULTISPECIES: DUF2795 domain-containing protein [Streptomyces]|uniref:DUF2795 domain-containing protein n=2 Tax=Streptomyces TaxID=1883 RepID=A0A3M8ESW6_9ACTN|nr:MULTISPECIES: DUF2795 domain-containing protein [Streptomyces]KNE79336.1 hypothetical protein ADZ36_28150 [Streptomyces fradiae]OFA39122.1 hypothetical protein BEN35_27515 [Streptomyces fradiae]PQM19723.1 DUF2795 domain-containing protein [Streptomyces xinghaiensis]RKM90711.1 DUF2795 domain-containing protein [Streptomyces xinghaiensis]RNC68532.1 DUF2795 domain-containing protein [Streptomyces xinghaiensis]
MAHTSVPQVLHAIKDVDFPAGKDELIRAAKVGGASEAAVAALRGIPAERYENREQVAHSVRVDPDSDLGHSRGQQGEQARKGAKRHLSQHLRDADKPPVEEELEHPRRMPGTGPRQGPRHH